jgi:hypothetical protein
MALVKVVRFTGWESSDVDHLICDIVWSNVYNYRTTFRFEGLVWGDNEMAVSNKMESGTFIQAERKEVGQSEPFSSQNHLVSKNNSVSKNHLVSQVGSQKHSVNQSVRQSVCHNDWISQSVSQNHLVSKNHSVSQSEPFSQSVRTIQSGRQSEPFNQSGSQYVRTIQLVSQNHLVSQSGSQSGSQSKPFCQSVSQSELFS